MAPSAYMSYSNLKTTHGPSVAHKINLFQLAHLPALIAAAAEEGLAAASQVREVEEYDVFLQEALFEAKREMGVYVGDVFDRREGGV